MPEFEYTATARIELLGIIHYTIDKWGKSQATKYVDGLDNLAQRLAETPQIGRSRNDLADGLICFPYVSHIIYYTKTPNGIAIIRLLHKHQDPTITKFIS